MFFDVLLDEADDVALRFNDCKQLVPLFIGQCEMDTMAGHLDSFSNRTLAVTESRELIFDWQLAQPPRKAMPLLRGILRLPFTIQHGVSEVVNPFFALEVSVDEVCFPAHADSFHQLP